MRRIMLIVGIVLGTASLASAGNWDQFIEKPGDRLPASKSPAVKTEKPAKRTAAKAPKAAPKKQQARGKKR